MKHEFVTSKCNKMETFVSLWLNQMTTLEYRCVFLKPFSLVLRCHGTHATHMLKSYFFFLNAFSLSSSKATCACEQAFDLQTFCDYVLCTVTIHRNIYLSCFELFYLLLMLFRKCNCYFKWIWIYRHVTN